MGFNSGLKVLTMASVLRGSWVLQHNCHYRESLLLNTRQSSSGTLKHSQKQFLLHKRLLNKVRERILEFGNNKERSKQTGGVLNLFLSMSLPALLSIPCLNVVRQLGATPNPLHFNVQPTYLSPVDATSPTKSTVAGLQKKKIIKKGKLWQSHKSKWRSQD